MKEIAQMEANKHPFKSKELHQQPRGAHDTQTDSSRTNKGKQEAQNFPSKSRRNQTDTHSQTKQKINLVKALSLRIITAAALSLIQPSNCSNPGLVTLPARANLNNQTRLTINVNTFYPSAQGVQITPPSSSPNNIQWTQILSKGPSQISLTSRNLHNCYFGKVIKIKETGKYDVFLFCQPDRLCIVSFKPEDPQQKIAFKSCFQITPSKTLLIPYGQERGKQICTKIQYLPKLNTVLVYCRAYYQVSTTKKIDRCAAFLVVLKQSFTESGTPGEKKVSYKMDTLSKFESYQKNGLNYISPRMPFKYLNKDNSTSPEDENPVIFGVNVSPGNYVRPMICALSMKLQPLIISSKNRRPRCFYPNGPAAPGMVKDVGFLCDFGGHDGCNPVVLALYFQKNNFLRVMITLFDKDIMSTGRSAHVIMYSSYSIKVPDGSVLEGSSAILARLPSMGSGYYVVLDTLSEVIILGLTPSKSSTFMVFYTSQRNRIRVQGVKPPFQKYHSSLEVKNGLILRKIYANQAGTRNYFQAVSMIEIHPQTRGSVNSVVYFSWFISEFLPTDFSGPGGRLAYLGIGTSWMLYYSKGLNLALTYSSMTSSENSGENGLPVKGASLNILGLNGTVLAKRENLELTQETGPAAVWNNQSKIEILKGGKILIDLKNLMNFKASNAQVEVDLLNQTFSRSQKLSLKIENSLGKNFMIEGGYKAIKWVGEPGFALILTKKSAYFCKFLVIDFSKNVNNFQVLKVIPGLKYSYYQPLLAALYQKSTQSLIICGMDYLNKKSIFKIFNLSKSPPLGMDRSRNIPFNILSLKLVSNEQSKERNSFFVIYGQADKQDSRFYVTLKRFTIDVSSSPITLTKNSETNHQLIYEKSEPVNIDIKVLDIRFDTNGEIWVDLSPMMLMRHPISPSRPDDLIVQYLKYSEVSQIRVEPTYKANIGYVVGGYFNQLASSFVARCYTQNAVFYKPHYVGSFQQQGNQFENSSMFLLMDGSTERSIVHLQTRENLRPLQTECVKGSPAALLLMVDQRTKVKFLDVYQAPSGTISGMDFREYRVSRITLPSDAKNVYSTYYKEKKQLYTFVDRESDKSTEKEKNQQNEGLGSVLIYRTILEDIFIPVDTNNLNATGLKNLTFRISDFYDNGDPGIEKKVLLDIIEPKKQRFELPVVKDIEKYPKLKINQKIDLDQFLGVSGSIADVEFNPPASIKEGVDYIFEGRKHAISKLGMEQILTLPSIVVGLQEEDIRLFQVKNKISKIGLFQGKIQK